MGRTVPSFRNLLEDIIRELSVFRRALREEVAHVPSGHQVRPQHDNEMD